MTNRLLVKTADRNNKKSWQSSGPICFAMSHRLSEPSSRHLHASITDLIIGCCGLATCGKLSVEIKALDIPEPDLLSVEAVTRVRPSIGSRVDQQPRGLKMTAIDCHVRDERAVVAEGNVDCAFRASFSMTAGCAADHRLDRSQGRPSMRGLSPGWYLASSAAESPGDWNSARTARCWRGRCAVAAKSVFGIRRPGSCSMNLCRITPNRETNQSRSRSDSEAHRQWRQRRHGPVLACGGWQAARYLRQIRG